MLIILTPCESTYTLKLYCIWIQEAHGPHRSPEKPVHINEYIWGKFWLRIKMNYKICPVVQEEAIFKFRECTFAILLLSPNVKRWLKLAQWFWRRRFFKYVNVFSQFHNYLPFKRVEPFIWTNLNPLHPKMICAKFGWKWTSGSGEEDFISFYCIFAIS